MLASGSRLPLLRYTPHRRITTVAFHINQTRGEPRHSSAMEGELTRVRCNAPLLLAHAGPLDLSPRKAQVRP
jgi:hypothetical protein